MSAVAAATPRSDVASHEAYAERLYERHHRALYGFCLKQLRRREDADDAVQMTFIYALLSLRRGIVPEFELPWLLTIARNECSTRRRSGMRRGEHEMPHDLDAIQDRLAVPERTEVATSEDFTAVLRVIPENQRRALLLREWRGLSYDEIGAELGLSQAATEALLFRARQNVARRLDERTGVKTLQGLPLLSFLRNLFQTAAAKTAAIGAGAALAVVAVPAAQPDAHHVKAVHPSVTRTTVPNPSTATAPRTVVRAPRDVGARTPRVRSAGRPVTHSPQASEIAPAPPTAASTPRSPAPQTASPPPASAQAASVPAAQQVVNTADDLVGTVTDVTQAVTLPTVTLPAVQTPTVPSVHLP